MSDVNGSKAPVIKEKDSVFKKWSYFWASGLGIGFIPLMPGTVASLATLPLAWFLFKVGQSKGLILGALLIFIAAYFFVVIALRYSKDNQDPSFIVVDEVVGQLVTFILPTLFWSSIWRLEIYLVGFVLFRFFDILKPFHVGWVQKNVKGALGVMLDDIVAALYATVVLFIVMAVMYYFFMGTTKPLV